MDEQAREGDLYVRCVCFSPDGQLLVTGAEDRLVRIWDIKAKKVVTVLSGHEQEIYSVDFARDGAVVVSGSGDRTARVWSVQEKRCVHVLAHADPAAAASDQQQGTTGKEAGVTSVAIRPDSQVIATGSLDRVIRLWSAKSGEPLCKLEGHTDSVYSVVFAPDGKSLISGSLDHSIKLWDLKAAAAEGQQPALVGSCRHTLTGHRVYACISLPFYFLFMFDNLPMIRTLCCPCRCRRTANTSSRVRRI